MQNRACIRISTGVHIHDAHVFRESGNYIEGVTPLLRLSTDRTKFRRCLPSKYSASSGRQPRRVKYLLHKSPKRHGHAYRAITQWIPIASFSEITDTWFNLVY